MYLESSWFGQKNELRENIPINSDLTFDKIYFRVKAQHADHSEEFSFCSFKPSKVTKASPANGSPEITEAHQA